MKMGSGQFFFAAFLFVSTADAALPSRLERLVSLAQEKRLSESPQWRKLLHYQRTWWGLGGYESQSKKGPFFLSPTGFEDPESELVADLRGFASTETFPEKLQHPQCRFPARFRWLQSQLHWSTDEIAPRVCAGYEEFKTTTDLQSASLIFSSYYLNNPASAFGHTFLRLARSANSRDEKKIELLDYGLNYAAVVDTSNPILYAVYGLFGFFDGDFTRIPYYYKVREYNDYESRDMWEYRLNLSREQLDRLVDHLWELGSTHFTYLYLTQNCSYHILSVIEAAMLDKDFVDQLSFVVLPAETVRVVTETPGLVSEVRFRPALRTTFQARLDEMESPQIEALSDLVESRDGKIGTLAELDKAQRAQVFDAATDYVDFKHFRDIVKNVNSEPAKFKQQLMVQRSQLAVASPDVVLNRPDHERPDSGHPAQRFGVEAGAGNSGGGFLGVNYRFALHDLLDPTRGYPIHSQIEFLRIRTKYYEQARRFSLDELSLFEVISLSPWKTFFRQLSWKFRMGGGTVRDLSCDLCFAMGMEVGAGLTLEPFRKVPLSIIATVDTEVSFSSGFANTVKPALGPAIALRWALTDRMGLLVDGRYRYQIFTPAHDAFRLGAEWRWEAFTNVALGARIVTDPRDTEASLSVMAYF